MLRFADLPIGAQFRFASEVTIAGLEPGPWRKISMRRGSASTRHVEVEVEVEELRCQLLDIVSR
jgi:hypothetical protein